MLPAIFTCYPVLRPDPIPNSQPPLDARPQDSLPAVPEAVLPPRAAFPARKETCNQTRLERPPTPPLTTPRFSRAALHSARRHPHWGAPRLPRGRGAVRRAPPPLTFPAAGLVATGSLPAARAPSRRPHRLRGARPANTSTRERPQTL